MQRNHTINTLSLLAQYVGDAMNTFAHCMSLKTMVGLNVVKVDTPFIDAALSYEQCFVVAIVSATAPVHYWLADKVLSFFNY